MPTERLHNASAIPFDLGEYKGVLQATSLQARPNARVAPRLRRAICLRWPLLFCRIDGLVVAERKAYEGYVGASSFVLVFVFVLLFAVVLRDHA